MNPRPLPAHAGPPSPALLTLTAVLFAALSPAPAAQFGDRLAEEDAIARYRQWTMRKPFRYHVQARAALARTRTAPALKILIADYDKPKGFACVKPASTPQQQWVDLKLKVMDLDSVHDFARYDVASVLGRNFGTHLWAGDLAALRERHKKPEDAWLWANTFAVEDADEGAAAIAFAESCKDVTLKAACLTALAVRDRRGVLGLVPKICAEVVANKRKPAVQRVLIGGLSNVILKYKDALSNAEMQTAIRAYVGLLGKEADLTLSAKLVIARHLSRTIGKDSLYVNPEAWIELLDRGYKAPKRDDHTVASPRFVGIEEDGDRICYVIDMSNSMLQPIDPSLIPKGPITGPKKKRKLKRGELPTEDDIPWHEIKTRFDVAREHLKISLRRLGKDKRFCVIWFGSDSGTLKSTKGMIKATPASINRCIKELDEIKAGPIPQGKSPQDAPHGWLKGDTNIHSGVRLAFQLTARGFVERHEHVDMKAMAEGCDAMILLSDGAPSVDDFYTFDKDYGDGKVVTDLESSRAAARKPMLFQAGPMNFDYYLRQDIRRMNVFRKVQIHCISIGDADLKLMEGIAEENHGTSFTFGRNTK